MPFAFSYSSAELPPDNRIRALATEILQRDEYSRWRPESFGWLSVLRQLARWLERYRLWMADLSVAQPVLYWLIVGALLLAALLLVAHLVWSLRAALVANAPTTAVPVDGTEPGFREEADRLARAGHFLDAAHRLELAAIDLLLRRRVLELSRSDPNRTLRRQLLESRMPEDHRRQLLQLLDAFERRWFRDRTEDRGLYEAWQAFLGRLDAIPEAQ